MVILDQPKSFKFLLYIETKKTFIKLTEKDLCDVGIHYSPDRTFIDVLDLKDRFSGIYVKHLWRWVYNNMEYNTIFYLKPSLLLPDEYGIQSRIVDEHGAVIHEICSQAVKRQVLWIR